MKILLLNNYFKVRGGSESVLLAQAKLLTQKKHRVNLFHSHDRLTIANNPLYSYVNKNLLYKKLLSIQPDIIHLHNIYHHLTPSVIDAAHANKIPLVMTMHDYKLICAVYKLWRRGKICEECAHKNYFNILKNNCNLKDHFGESLLLWTEMNLHHNILHTYDKIDVFISPSKFLIKKFKEMGWKKKIVYLPNFIFQKDCQLTSPSESKTIIYFGRLTAEKGLDILLEAFQQALSVKRSGINLKIIGDGPEKNNLKFKISNLKLTNVKLTGWLEGEKLKKEIKNSLFTVLPSIWYENNPLSILESFSLGKPVIASNIGGIPELVKDNVNGLLVEPGNIVDLSQKMNWLVNHPKTIIRLGNAGYNLVKEKYNEEVYYQKLMEIYKKII